MFPALTPAFQNLTFPNSMVRIHVYGVLAVRHILPCMVLIQLCESV
jgi:hypothetical protein